MIRKYHKFCPLFIERNHTIIKTNMYHYLQLNTGTRMWMYPAERARCILK